MGAWSDHAGDGDDAADVARDAPPDPDSGGGGDGCPSSTIAGHGATFTGGATALGPLNGAQIGDYNYVAPELSGHITGVQLPGRTGYVIETEVSAGVDATEFISTKGGWNSGDEMWYAMSVSVDQLPADNTWELLHRFYGADSSGANLGPPPVALEIDHGKLSITVRGGASPTSSPFAPATTNVFHDLLWHIKWSGGSDGFVEVYYRQAGSGPLPCTPQVLATGPNTYPSGQSSTRAATGVDRAAQSVVQHAYYAGLWARTTRMEAEELFQ
jgi:hypothetical protein